MVEQGCGDDAWTTGTMWGPWGPHHDKHVGGHLQFLYMCVYMHGHMGAR